MMNSFTLFDVNVNKIEDPDADFDDHLEKCRCCFKNLRNDLKCLEIDDNVQRNFFNLTNVELIVSSEYSSKVCIKCSSQLEIIAQFRNDLIGNQLKLYNHVNEHKEEDNNCDIFNFNYAETIVKQDDNVKFYCDYCKFSSSLKFELQQHIKSHVKKKKRKSSKNENQTFCCESCGLSFTKRFHLNAHVRAKHTEKVRNHICHICNKAFYSTENLKKHVDSHNEKDMPCEFCGKLFSCINNLRTHLYYHSDPKFTCEIESCGKKFYMKKRLRAHMKTHANQKDFLCQFCDKSYFSQNDLNRHIFSIHQKLRFFCEVPGCHGNFSRREYYKKHALTHHQNIGPERLEILIQHIRDAVPSQKEL